MKKQLFLLIAVLVACSSCKKFLSEYSQNSTYTESVQDLDELMIGECYANMSYLFNPAGQVAQGMAKPGDDNDFMPWIHVMDDDSQEYATGRTELFAFRNPFVELAGFHRWQTNPFNNALNNTLANISFKKLYRHIAVINSVLFQIPKIREKGGDPFALKRIEGECYFLRAQYYLMLVNLYAVPYSKSSASTDPGVPLKITEYVDDQQFTRASVGQVYDLITSDLIRAGESLDGIKQASKYRANQVAAFALLSRVYLYTEAYEKAIEYASKVMDDRHYVVMDLNGYTDGTSFTYKDSPETIFTHGNHTMHWVTADDYLVGTKFGYNGSYSVSDELMQKYEANDLRPKAFFKLSTIGKKTICWKLRNQIDGVVSDIYLIRFPEVLLNKAEAEAMLGRDGEAKITLQELRTNRFSASNLQSVTVSGNELIQFIREERRRELCFEGHRWFDLRRYAVNSIYPTQKSIDHVALESNNYTYTASGYYQLKPYNEDKAGYVIPIPDYEIDINKGSIVNLQRPARTLIK